MVIILFGMSIINLPLTEVAMNFSGVVEILSFISSIITILGVGGIVSWSVNQRDSSQFATTVYKIFTYSIKTVLCFFVFLILYILGLNLFDLSYSIIDSLFWKTIYFDFSVGTISLTGIIVFLMNFGLLLPIFFLSCSSIYKWSLNPFK
jgi:hypothetical protein